ncbi:MAG TPA: NAD-dependent epimerase/dehydratase family protein [Thermoplasmata archaeon]|nr:NAD-dependent epimerase/dehydratase family protein [Thermoplasmata archaeon]
MVAVVSGGSGFIGSHLVDRLLEDGFEVRVLDTLPPHRPEVEFAKVDINSKNEVLDACRDAEQIFHLAAVSNVDEAYQKPVETVRANTLGTLHLLEAARRSRTERFVFASTVWVYGGARGTDVHEDSPFYMPGAGHIYTSTKIASELYIHDYSRLYGVPFTILRYGIPYGPRARAGTLVPIFIRKALLGEPLTIFGDGMQYRNFLYVEDLARGNVLALANIAENQIYNLEGPRPISVKEVAETIQKILGEVKIEYKPPRPGDYRGKDVSSKKAKRDLKWEPVVEFEEGMRRYIEWYREAELPKLQAALRRVE